MLKFRFADFEREGTAFNTLAEDFIDRTQFRRLEQFLRDLRGFQDSGAQMYSWGISRDAKISTIVSEGGMDPNGHGEDVLGRFSCRWDIRKTKKGGEFELYGQASSHLEIVVVGDKGCKSNEQASLMGWNMDIATAADAPGCYVHSQVAISKLPRFPGVALSPYAAFEFLLGEIFHERWEEQVASARNSEMWRGVQKKRMTEYLNWLQKKIQTNSTSPWMALKAARPENGTFAT